MPKHRSKRETSDPERVGALLQFLQLGFRDYLGARTLLRAGLPLEGAILGSTAVEKYFKAFGWARGNRLKGHPKAKHINLVRNFIPELFGKLNPEFLRFLQRCYELRYTDQLPRDFNLTVFARETLAELDFTVLQCDQQVNLRRGDMPLKSSLARAIEARHELVLTDNYLLQEVTKDEFLRQPDRAYSIRNRPVQGILEVEFTVRESPTDGEFNREALRLVTPAELQVRADEKVPDRASDGPDEQDGFS